MDDYRDPRRDGLRPTMPSREVLVTQAVLNAAAEVFPLSTSIPGVLWAGRYVENVAGDWPGHSLLFQAVPRHFRVLVESYGGTVCPSR